MIATSLGQYLSQVKQLRRRWQIPKKDELWFRAEDARYRKTHLQPGLYRPRDSGKRKSIQNLLDLEDDLYSEFQRCAPQLSEVKSGGDDWRWDSYFLMQHHGVPTRLLDWSDGALIALHFAVRDKPTPPKSGSVIYVLDPYWLVDKLDEQPDRENAKRCWKEYIAKVKASPSSENEWDTLYLPSDKEQFPKLLATPQIPLLWDTPHVARRVAAQRSRFMIFGADPLWLTGLLKTRGSRIAPISIPAGSISRISQELRDAGVTESVVFPDLDGLGRELKQTWKMRR
jgi:hypothetical protein